MSLHLYRWQELSGAPTQKAIVCSTRESADAAQKLVGIDYVCASLPEEPGGWQSVDTTKLFTRETLLLPDNTPDCHADMANFGRRLAEMGCALKGFVDSSDQLIDWNVASWQGDAPSFRTWAGSRLRPVPDPAPQAAAAPPAASTSPEPAAAGPSQGDAEPPPITDIDFPPGSRPEPPRKRKRANLSIVDGSNALQPDPDTALEPEPLSEDAFAHDFATRYANDWRRVAAWDRWLYWNGDGWLEDREDARVQPMRELVREHLISPQAAHLTPDGRRKLSRQALIYASVRLAGTDERLRTIPEVWDADPWLLGVPGGVVDLKTGSQLEAHREQCITMRASVGPKKGTPAKWLEMLKFWTGGDEDVIGWLRRYCGYALTGDNREQCMAFFYGPAQAGKGTVLRTLAGILGSVQDGSNPFKSYHYEAPIATFMESRNERHSTELAALYGKRLVTAEEPAAGAKWDEGKLKWITGGSQITARFISRDNFSFTMSGKIIVAANHRPRLATSDKAIRRRMHVVPFEHPVADEDRDNNLDAKLRDEWPQILHWLLEGCLEWQQCGLGLPERIADSTDTYLESEDTLGAWLDENCEREGRTEGASLYENYRKWCEMQGEHSFSRRGWANALAERGFQPTKGTAGVRMIDGLSLKLGANLP